MTFEQQVLRELTTIKRELTTLRKERVKSEKEYITLAEASEKFGVSESKIRQDRYAGKLTDFTRTANGRNYKYSVDELEKLYEIKN